MNNMPFPAGFFKHDKIYCKTLINIAFMYNMIRES